MALETIRQKDIHIVIPHPPNRSVRDWVRVLFRHRWKVVTVFITVCLVTAITLILTPSVFESKATLLVRPGVDKILPTAVASPLTEQEIMPLRAEVSAVDLESELSLLSSRDVLEQVVKQLGVHRLMPEIASSSSSASKNNDMAAQEQALMVLQQRLHISLAKQANVITVAMHGHDPLLAQTALRYLLDAYFARRQAVYEPPVDPVAADSQEQLLALRQTLAEKNAVLRRFQQQNTEIAQHRQRTLADKIAALDVSLSDTESQIKASEARLESLQSSLAKQPVIAAAKPVSQGADSIVTRLKKSLIDMRQEESKLSTYYPDSHLPLVDIRRRIAIAEEALEQEQAKTKRVNEATTAVADDAYVNPLLLASETERAALSAQRARRESLLNELNQRGSEMDELLNYQRRLTQLRRDVELANNRYQSYREDWHQVELASALAGLSVPKVALAQTASLQQEPIAPDRLLTVVIGLILGLLGGFGVALIAEFFDETLANQAEVQRKLQLPVLATFTVQELKQCT